MFTVAVEGEPEPDGVEVDRCEWFDAAGLGALDPFYDVTRTVALESVAGAHSLTEVWPPEPRASYIMLERV